MSTLKLENLTEEEKRQLVQELEAEQKFRKQRRVENREAFKKLSEEFVNRNIDNFVERHEAIEQDIINLFEDYKTILDLKAETYGVKVKSQDTHTSTLKDGSASISIGRNVSIGFDGTESSGVTMIKDYITTLAKEGDSSEKLIKMVNVLLKESKKTGMLNPSNIVQLSQLKDQLNSDQFNEGLDIITAAQTRVQNSMFVRGWKFIKVGETNKKLEFSFSV